MPEPINIAPIGGNGHHSEHHHSHDQHSDASSVVIGLGDGKEISDFL
jgi:hypothetical protein